MRSIRSRRPHWIVLVTFLWSVGLPMSLSAQSKLYWIGGAAGQAGTGLYRADLDGASAEFIVDSAIIFSGASGSNQPRGIDFDGVNNKIYWGERERSLILRADPDGSNVETVLDLTPLYGNGSLDALAIDDVAGRMFVVYNAGSDGDIYSMNLDGSGITPLVADIGLVTGIALDPLSQQFYLAFRGGAITAGKKAVIRYDYDGTNLAVINDDFPDGFMLSTPFEVDLDLIHQKIYWTDPWYHRLRRSALDGSNVEDIILTAGTPGDGFPTPTGLAIDTVNAKLYWSENNNTVIKRSDLDGTNIETISPSTRGIQLAIDLPAPSPAPFLSIPDAFALAGGTVDVPVILDSRGAEVAAVVFSIDIDETCLDFDPTDGNLDSLPDSVMLNVPGDFTANVFFDAGDTDGELDITLADVTPPVMSFSDGTLMTLTYSTTCSPSLGVPVTVPLSFSADPQPTFSDPLAQAVIGGSSDGSVTIFGGEPGDCNGNSVLDAPDLVACGLEIFDGDGSSAFDTPGGTFAGNPVGCDANADRIVDAGDVSCKNRLFFGLSCSSPPTLGEVVARNGAPRLLLLEELIPVGPNSVRATIALDTAGQSLSALAFSLDIDESVLRLDPTDADADGVPDAVRFLGTAASLKSAAYDADDTDGELDILLADLQEVASPFVEGVLLEIEFEVLAPSTGGGLSFATMPTPSFGNITGGSIAGSGEPFTPPLFADSFESGNLSAWSFAVP